MLTVSIPLEADLVPIDGLERCAAGLRDNPKTPSQQALEVDVDTGMRDGLRRFRAPGNPVGLYLDRQLSAGDLWASYVAELKKGTDFAELAKTKSKDPGASDGGDLGWFTKDQMVPEFSEIAFKLEKGQLSDPVKSQFGWHVIKVEDKRMRQPPEFEKVKDQLEQYVVRRQQSAVITKLRAEGKIERIGAPAPTAVAPAAPGPATPPAEQKK